MSKTIKLFGLMAVIALASTSVWADAPAAPTVAVNGFVDAYYTYNFTNGSNSSLGMGNVGTFFNTADEDFALGMAEVDINGTLGNTSGHISLNYGQEGNLGIGAAPGIDLLQAYITYAPDQWTFNFGRWMTWMGNEVVSSKANVNYS